MRHSRHQKTGEVPKGLRNPDKDAAWSKSEHHGRVYGYGLHLTVSASGFPADADVEKASVSESEIIDRKADFIKDRKPSSLTGDNSYCNLRRIRSWAGGGTAPVTPGRKLKEKRPESAGCKKFVREPENMRLPGVRKTAVEPVSDLISKVPGLGNSRKQLPIRGIGNVRTFLTVGTLIVQSAMIINNVRGLPLREISHIIATFT